MAVPKPELRVKGEGSGLFGVKAERRMKAEPGSGRASSSKLEPGVKGEPGRGAASVKAELLRQQGPRLKAETPSAVSALVERGLQLRAMAARVKQERELKVKKELKRVKREQGKGKAGKRKTGARRGVRRKGSVARRNASREVMNRPVPLSPELAELVGASELSRPEVMKRVWAHCREKGLLNPADKREALFDERLQALFGTPTARIFELHSLMMPHLDYAGMGAEAAAAAGRGAGAKAEGQGEGGAAAKAEKAAGAKREAKTEAKREAGPRPKCEVPHAAESAGSSAAKREHPQDAGAPALAKRERPQEGVKQQQQQQQQLKRELPAARAGVAPGALAAAVRAIVPRLTRIGRTSVGLEFRAPLGDMHLEASAVPVAAGSGGSAGSTVRKACTVEFCEGADGAMEPCAEAHLDGLQPGAAYRISVEAVVPNAEGVAEEVTSAEAALPQRASPAKWTPHEAQLWCGSLQVPELARKVREYRIDGATLLALGEEDLRALGLTAPFLVRRVTAALQELRAG